MQVYVDLDPAGTSLLFPLVFGQYLDQYGGGSGGHSDEDATAFADATWQGQRFYYARAEDVGPEAVEYRPVGLRIRLEAIPRDPSERIRHQSLYRDLAKLLM